MGRIESGNTLAGIPLATRQLKPTDGVHAALAVTGQQNLSATSSLRFGQLADKQPVDIKGAKGLWITTEFTHPTLPDKLKAGGLAQVSSTIPWQLKQLGVDVRPIFPYYAALADQGFTKADIPPVMLPSTSGRKPEPFELYYKVIDGVTCYAIGSPSISKFNDLYQIDKDDKDPLIQYTQPQGMANQDSGGMGYGGNGQAQHHSGGMGYIGNGQAQHHSGGMGYIGNGQAQHHSGGKGYIGNGQAQHHSGGMGYIGNGQAQHQSGGMGYGPQAADAKDEGKVINKNLFKFNQAVAAFAPLLNGNVLNGDKSAKNPAWQFNGEADVNFFNDWMAGVILGELQAKNKTNHYMDKTQSVFFVHNTYNPQSMTIETAEKLGLHIPKTVKEEFTQRFVEEIIPPEKPVDKKHVKPDSWFNRWLSNMLWDDENGNGEASKADTKAERRAKIITSLNKNGWGVSPLAWGLRFSDLIIMNDRFKQTNLDTDFPNDPQLRYFLGQKDNQALVFDMHHAVSDKYNPYTSEALNKKGYVHLAEVSSNKMPANKVPADAIPVNSTLKSVKTKWAQTVAANAKSPSTPNEVVHSAATDPAKPLNVSTADDPKKSQKIEAIKAFKATNKIALQKEFGLKKDPNAVIYCTLARANDPRQKGLFRLVGTIEKFLAENPHAQFIIGGGFNEQNAVPEIAALAKLLKSHPEFSKRVALPPFLDQGQSMRLLAGATFIMNPSTYEPYGLAQLEGMKYATPPLVTPRDGCYSTVYDPHVLPNYGPSKNDRNRAAYGQTGYFVDIKTDNMDYLNTIDAYGARDVPSHPVIRQQNEAFLAALQRTYNDAMAGKHLDIAYNGMRYVNNEHSFDKIAELYVPVLQKAMARKQQHGQKLVKQA
jgi:glycogen synthase